MSNGNIFPPILCYSDGEKLCIFIKLLSFKKKRVYDGMQLTYNGGGEVEWAVAAASTSRKTRTMTFYFSLSDISWVVQGRGGKTLWRPCAKCPRRVNVLNNNNQGRRDTYYHYDHDFYSPKMT